MAENETKAVTSYELSEDKGRLDLEAIHQFLSQSYWAAGIPCEVLQRAIDNSLCVGVYFGASQVGFARAVTDKATFAYLADVYVLESHRNNGLARMIMDHFEAHPDLKGIRRRMLVTRDAHGLYRKYGYRTPQHPENIMEIRLENPYDSR
jgi:GNAT superfamily N-acetyltransferase